jgi:hypothetical protein
MILGDVAPIEARRELAGEQMQLDEMRAVIAAVVDELLDDDEGRLELELRLEAFRVVEWIGVRDAHE